MRGNYLKTRNNWSISESPGKRAFLVNWKRDMKQWEIVHSSRAGLIVGQAYFPGWFQFLGLDEVCSEKIDQNYLWENYDHRKRKWPVYSNSQPPD